MDNQLERNIQYTLDTHAAEQMVPSEDALNLCRECARGNINADDAVMRIAEKYGVKSRRDND